jgi:hypothetical protein
MVQSLCLIVCPAIFDRQVFTLNKPGIFETLTQSAHRLRQSFGRGGISARLLAFVNIAARLKELQAEAAAKHQITVESMIADFAQDAKDAKADKQHGAAVSARTAIAKLAGLWVDRSENLNGNYAISDKPLSEQEWKDQYVRRH